MSLKDGYTTEPCSELTKQKISIIFLLIIVLIIFFFYFFTVLSACVFFLSATTIPGENRLHSADIVLTCGTIFLRESIFADWRFFVFCGNYFLRLGEIFRKYLVPSIGNMFVFIEFVQ